MRQQRALLLALVSLKPLVEVTSLKSDPAIRLTISYNTLNLIHIYLKLTIFP
jgi:hypothetical protein